MKKLLMVAFHFPPFAGSSGVQRTLRFVQHLPAMGWQPIVLSASACAYENKSDDLMVDIPDGVVVRRALALDAARHFQLHGSYLDWMARPDRWMSWKWDAVRQGLKLIQQHKPDMIWSTYPIASAHAIASILHQKTALPWVADFRDPMAQDGYPAEPKRWLSYKKIESDAATRAKCCVFTSPGAAKLYQQRYPVVAARMRVIENGYDEESFSSTTAKSMSASCQNLVALELKPPFILLHSGIVYPSERDPIELFKALRVLKDSGRLRPSDFRIRFRASGHDALLHSKALALGVLEFIELAHALPYREALQEMMGVNALLIMQASNCNAQIPAKIYEYLRAGRPILGLTDPGGDTATVLKHAGISAIARLDSAIEISSLLPNFLNQCGSMLCEFPDAIYVKKSSRLSRTETLVKLLDEAMI